MYKILFPDNLHIHERGFKSLFEFIKEKKYKTIFVAENDDLKVLYGNYKNKKTLFLKEYDELKSLTNDELFKKKYFGISLFSLAKAEMLSYLMTKENWYNSDISSNENEIFNKAYDENKEVLLLNLAVTLFWLSFWKKRLKFKNYKNINISIVFSGSLIYVKTLSYLLQNTPIRVFVVEHFFTGNDYYFEEKYTHIANNSDIKFNNVYNSLREVFIEKDEVTRNNEIIKAINKIKLGKNKNVIQPDKIDLKFSFSREEKTVLILGQVINDFSILETDLQNINSLQTYKNMIQGILDRTPFNIIFKAHPWEKSKINLKRSLTKDYLINFVSKSFSVENQKRFEIVEDFNLNQLFDYSDYIVGFCSQSLLEAAFAGKKTHQIGKAFFGYKGFTYDYENEEEFIKILENGKVDTELNLSEYDSLLEFFAILLEYHLVSIFNSGKSKLIEKLTTINTITLVEQKGEDKLLPSIKPIKSNHLDSSSALMDISHNKSIKRYIIEEVISSMSSDKKFKKFKSNPKKFFNDSNYFIVKLLGKIY